MNTTGISEYIATLIAMMHSTELIRIVVNELDRGELTIYAEVQHIYFDKPISFTATVLRADKLRPIEIGMDIIDILEKHLNKDIS
jgi:hypothetical protein